MSRAFSEIDELVHAFDQLGDHGCRHVDAGWCYVVSASDEHLKIGSCRTATRDALIGRMKAIQALCPSPIHLLRLFTGGRAREKAFHRQFASQRLHNEWFCSTVIADLPFSGCPDCDACLLPGGIHPDDLALLRGRR